MRFSDTDSFQDDQDDQDDRRFRWNGPKLRIRRSPFGWAVIMFLVFYLSLTTGRPAAVLAQSTDPDLLRPALSGIFVIEAANDSTAGFEWITLVDQAKKCLVWDGGAITLPDSVIPGTFGLDDITIPFSKDLLGVSHGRRLLFTPGRFVIDHPLYLSDGSCHCFLAKGDILIENGRIIYRMREGSTNPRSQYIILAAMIIMIVLLLARSRSRLRKQ